MILINRESPSHWYLPDGTPYHEVPRADGKGMRSATLRDARKVGAFPSVTQILAIIAKPSLDCWKQEQAVISALTLPRRDGEPLDDFAKRVVTDMTSQVRDAADLGSAIHAAIETYAQNGDVPENPDVFRLFEPARAWFDEEVSEVSLVEAVVTDRALGYAGRVDLVATLRSTCRPTVVDFKSQRMRAAKNGSFQPVFYDTWPLQLEAYRRALGKQFPAFAAADIANVVIGSTEPMPVSMKVWPREEASARLRAFLAARQLWIWSKGYCPTCPRTDLPEAA